MNLDLLAADFCRKGTIETTTPVHVLPGLAFGVELDARMVGIRDKATLGATKTHRHTKLLHHKLFFVRLRSSHFLLLLPCDAIHKLCNNGRSLALIIILL